MEVAKSEKSYLDEAIDSCSHGSLVFEDKSGIFGKPIQIGFPISFSLNKVNKRINIFAGKDFDQENKQKALLTAMHYLYLKLAENKFDVSLLERVMQGDCSMVFNPVIIAGHNDEQFTKSTLTVNDSYSESINITQRLRESGDGFEFEIISNLLPKLYENEDCKKYLNCLQDLARTTLSPMVKSDDGTRVVFLDSYKKYVENLPSTSNWMSSELLQNN